MENTIIVTDLAATGSVRVWQQPETGGGGAVRDQTTSMPIDETPSATPYRVFGTRIIEALNTIRNW
jgi:hypothetical protein